MSRVIGERVKRIIKNRGMSYKEAGERLGISKQDMNYIINVKADENWKEWEIERVCKVLKVEYKEGEWLREVKWGEKVR